MSDPGTSPKLGQVQSPVLKEPACPSHNERPFQLRCNWREHPQPLKQHQEWFTVPDTSLKSVLRNKVHDCTAIRQA